MISTPKTFAQLEYDLTNDRYSENLTERTLLQAMLQNPTLRLVNCTPFKGEIIDSEVFLDAQNAFIDFLSGGQPTQVDVESPEDLDLFDNETTWVLAQNPDIKQWNSVSKALLRR